jgi:hypothetical protein
LIHAIKEDEEGGDARSDLPTTDPASQPPDPQPPSTHHRQIREGEGEEGASRSTPPLLRSMEGEGGCATGGRGRHVGGPPRLHAGEGGMSVVLLASMSEREAHRWYSSPPRRRGSYLCRCRRMEGEELRRESVRERY